MSEWKKVKIGDFLTESKIIAEHSDADHRITVRLNCKGIEKRDLKAEKEGATKYYIRKSGQFIYGKQNIHKGAFGIIPKELDGYTSSADLPSFDFDLSKCNPEWLCLCLKVDERYKKLQKNVKGVGSQRLAVNVFLDEEIPLPDLQEQNKIILKVSESVSKAEKILEEIDTQKEYVKLLRQNILQDAIEGKLTADWRKSHPVIKGNPDYDAEALFQKIQKTKASDKKQKGLPPITDEEKPFEIPEGWKWVRLGEISNKIEAGKSILCNERIPNDDEIGIVRTGVCSFGTFKENESKTCLSKNAWHEEYAIKKGDFLIGRANTLELVGSCVIVGSINKKLMLSDKILRIIFYNSVKTFFILYMMKSRFLRSQIEKSSTGSSPTMKNISQDSIRNYVLPFPPLKEQEEIVNKIESLLAKVTELENQIQERKTLSEKLAFGIIKEKLEV